MITCMKSLDEHTFYLFAFGAIYILHNMFKTIDRAICRLSDKIEIKTQHDSSQEIECQLVDASVQTDDILDISDSQIIENVDFQEEPKSKKFFIF